MKKIKMFLLPALALLLMIPVGFLFAGCDISLSDEDRELLRGLNPNISVNQGVVNSADIVGEWVSDICNGCGTPIIVDCINEYCGRTDDVTTEMTWVFSANGAFTQSFMQITPNDGTIHMLIEGFWWNDGRIVTLMYVSSTITVGDTETSMQGPILIDRNEASISPDGSTMFFVVTCDCGYEACNICTNSLSFVVVFTRV